MSLGKQEKQRFDRYASRLRRLGRNKSMVIPSRACNFCERPLTSIPEVQRGYCNICIEFLRNNLNNISIPFPNKRDLFVFR